MDEFDDNPVTDLVAGMEQVDAALDYVLDDPELCEKCRMAAIRCIRKAAKEKP